MEDLIQWLREQVAIDRERADDLPNVLDSLPDGVPCWLDVHGRPVIEPRLELLARCEAQDAVLGLWGIAQDVLAVSQGTILAGGAKVRVGAYEKAVRGTALAYRHRPGYREEWRP